MKAIRLPIAISLLVLATCCLVQLRGADAAEPSASELVRRGEREFIAGKINESILSFEAAAKSRPELKAYLWQLGIAYYYAGRFTEGRDLFELHQTVNTADVENAVWHFLCVARVDGLETARKKLIPITGDARVPMKQVHALFAGTGTAEEVLAAAEDDQRGAANRKNSLCYAHLYLALFEEARGNAAKSKEHISKAVGDYRQVHYMGEVARIHSELRSAAESRNKAKH